MNDLRSIALCNTLYKLLSKILANRIKSLLTSIVSESQSALVPGRLISDNIMLAYEINHYLKRKNQGKLGFVGVKLGMSKAFDKVNWGFLLAALSNLGFSSHIVNMIRQMICTVNYNILLEGGVIGFVTPKRANLNAYADTMITNVVTTWKKPPTGMLKINVDAALDTNNKKMGFGYVIRDSTGHFLSARCLPWPSIFIPNEAKAIGEREALTWIKDSHLDNIQVESDYLEHVNGIIHGHNTFSSFDLIIDDIKEIVRGFDNISFLFVKRSANM
ncbi:PREDICTED: uncharacterized protein LOC109149921 [Ipomoea nil]|uniref:uncharacterized protein LOC109149921 n=1 Tax=Ipomoea nil TaxID=35883 RepID=UPI000901515D|nr:PREDICTED: uncharacterized protein LOC109149921 [Ipomoea nil]